MPQTFFTSDNHYGHANIIKHCNRPFSSVDEMDEVMIENHNKVVKPEDYVYHLGDISYRTPEQTVAIFKRLNGRKALIRGNHDNVNTVARLLTGQCIASSVDLQDIFDKPTNTKLVLCHYPIEEWNGKYHGSIHLHGHSHGSTLSTGIRRMDIGVDSNSFTPISMEEVLKKMKLVVVHTKPRN